jgi:SET domain-containing protein
MSYQIAKSEIHGEGVLATKSIKKDEVIGLPLYMVAWIFPVITKELGKKINHSYKPNAYLKKDPSELKWYLIAHKNIAINEEITINYNNTPWFIDKPMPWYR